MAWEQVGLNAVRLLSDAGTLDPNGFQLAPWPSAASHDLAWSGAAFVHTHDEGGPRVMFFEADAGPRVWPLPDGGSTSSLSLTTETNNNIAGRTITLTPLADGRVGALWPRSNGGQWPSAIHSAVVDDDGGISELVLRPNTMPWLSLANVAGATNGAQFLACASGSVDGVPPGHVFGVSRRLDDGGIGALVTMTTDAGQPSADCAMGSGPGVALLVYRNNSEFEPTLRFQLLSGTSLAPATERLLSGAAAPQEHPAVARAGNTSLPWLLAWSDARTPYGGFDLYGQRTNGVGSGGPAFLISSAAADEVGPRLLGAGDAGFVLTWSEGNPLDGTTPSVPKAMRLTPSGLVGPRIDLPVTGARYQTPVAALDDRSVVITSGFNGNLFEAWSFPLDGFDGGVTRTALTPNGTHNGVRLVRRGGGVLAAWDDDQPVLGKQLTDAGTAQGPVVVLVQGAFNARNRNVTLADPGDTLIAWEDWSSGEPRLRARYLLVADGGLTTPFEVSTAPGAQRSAHALALSDGRALVAWEQQTDAGIDVFVKFVLGPDAGIDPTGRSWAGDGGATQNLRPVLASDGVGRVVLAWNRLAEDGRTLSAHWRGVTVGAPLGGTCTRNEDCGEGPCVDGRCCDSACGGSNTQDCQVCAASLGATSDGHCTFLGAAHVCRPARGAVCDLPEVCEDTPDCPLDLVQNTGMSCGSGGTCDGSGFCASDAGVGDGGTGGGGGATGGGGGATGGGGGATGGGGGATGGGGGATGGGGGATGGGGGATGGGGGATGGGGGATGGGGGATGGGSATGGGGGAAGGGSATGGGEATGGGSATGGGDATGGGAGDDAGVRDSLSHYSWNQGCGCSGTSSSASLPALLVGALLFFRRRRASGRAVATALVLLLPLSAFAADKKPRVAFSGLSCPSGIAEDEVRVLSDYLHTRLSALEVYEVIGTSDIQQLIGLERQKQLLGCAEGSSCLSEIGGALDADRLLSGTIARVGQTMVLNLMLLDAKQAQAIHRNGTRVKGQAVEAAFDLIDGLLLELAQRDPLVADKLVKPPPPAVPLAKPERTWALSVGARLDADFVGIAREGAPALAPAITAHFQDRIFGAAAAFIIAPLPGVRAELRIAWPDLAVRPYLGAGAVLFGPSFGLRGCLGVLGRVGPVQLFLDAGAEGFLTGPEQFHALALLVGAGVAWAF